jgi:hypothetical protein
MVEYRVVVIGIESPPSLEAHLNKMAKAGWTVKCQIEFRQDAALLLERFDTKADTTPDVAPRAFQETLNRIVGR